MGFKIPCDFAQTGSGPGRQPVKRFARRISFSPAKATVEYTRSFMMSRAPIVLMAVDSTLAAKPLASAFELDGWCPHLCSSVEEALELLPDLRPKAIITDVAFRKGLGGHVLAEAGRRLFGGDIALIALTAVGSRGEEQHANPPFDRVLLQPIDVYDLLRTLRHASPQSHTAWVARRP